MFTGSLVRLREYRKEDILPAQQFLNDPEIKHLLFYGIPLPSTLQDEEKWFADQSANDANYYNFAIETLQEGKYIGGCGLQDLDWKNRHTMLGIFVGDKNYWNRGYGSDALKVLIRFIFMELGLYKIKLDVFGFNERAIRAYQKCGFTTEAVFKKELYRAGAFHDVVRMVLFNPDVESNR